MKDKIEATITSKLCGDLLREGKKVMMHWGADFEDNGEWHRPPKEMLPPGTNYRFQKHSVQTSFTLNEEGEGEIILAVPDSMAPKKIRFICFVEDPVAADVWFKNSNEGDFEMYVCPDQWRSEIDRRDEDAAKQKKDKGLLSILSKPFQRALSDLTEGDAKEEVTEGRAHSPPREEELDNSWRPHRKLQRTKSAEIRHLNKERREAIAADASSRHKDDRKHVKLSVMLPLDLHKWRISSLEKRLWKLKEAGVHGVMCDMWWGMVEKTPKNYEFTCYTELVNLCAKIGLEVEFVMSFHKCGGNVGDSCSVPLPKWVQACADKEGRSKVYYTDKHGTSNDEYLSLSCDEKPFLEGRTPVQVYTDYMEAFADNFHEHFHKTISKVQIGLGPAGELRYPSFPLTKWCYPGPGEFQCYDEGLKGKWAQWCQDNGKADWSHKFPGAGDYNTEPDNSKFWQGDYKSDYGKAFLSWYRDELLGHGKRILAKASEIFSPFKVEISGKIAGIHWLYKHPSHATECCAGYYNTNEQNFYLDVANLFKSVGATFDFTCMEIHTGDDINKPYQSDPEALVWQAKEAALKAGVKFAGENALPVGHWDGFEMILKKAKYLDSFCFLRFTEHLISQQYDDFKHFAHKMGKSQRPLIHA